MLLLLLLLLLKKAHIQVLLLHHHQSKAGQQGWLLGWNIATVEQADAVAAAVEAVGPALTTACTRTAFLRGKRKCSF
ncbi:MAG: hypothetical protein J3R72DRAFT_437881 [Linnemannia gamsii]|nr:MAG: hypothetical protein J3R72DRAFT_437881 [Linnemannia gamsii]